MTSVRQTWDVAMPLPQAEGSPAPWGQNPNPNRAGEVLHDPAPTFHDSFSCLCLSTPTPLLPIHLVIQDHQASVDPRTCQALSHLSTLVRAVALTEDALQFSLAPRACHLLSLQNPAVMSFPQWSLPRPPGTMDQSSPKRTYDSVWHLFFVSFPTVPKCLVYGRCPLRVCIDMSLWVHREASVGVEGGAGALEGSCGWRLVCPLGWPWAGAAIACGVARGRPLG